MEIVLFRARPRPDVDQAEYGRAFTRMLELAQQTPGFLGIEGFAGEDGTELAVVRFDTPENLLIWRNHPEHLLTQQRGRDEFYQSYDITVATVARHYEWP